MPSSMRLSGFVQELERIAPPLAPNRKVFSQGIAFRVIVRHEDAAQVGMPPKTNSHHIVDFALHEVGAFPEIGERLHSAIGFGHAGLEPNTMPLSDRIKLV